MREASVVGYMASGGGESAPGKRNPGRGWGRFALAMFFLAFCAAIQDANVTIQQSYLSATVVCQSVGYQVNIMVII